MWTVYAIKIEGTLRYVGLTKNVGLREKQHNLYGYAGMSVSLTPLAVFETLAEADERETMLIQALSPPDNVSKSGIHRPGEWVIFPRMFNGVIISDVLRRGTSTAHAATASIGQSNQNRMLELPFLR